MRVRRYLTVAAGRAGPFGAVARSSLAPILKSIVGARLRVRFEM